jgi:hypothetical protein
MPQVVQSGQPIECRQRRRVSDVAAVGVFAAAPEDRIATPQRGLRCPAPIFLSVLKNPAF